MGPQFFRGLRSEGIKQALFCDPGLCAACLVTAYFYRSPFAFGSSATARALWCALALISLVLGVARRTRSAAGRFARDPADRDQRHVDRLRNHLHLWNGRGIGFPGHRWTKNPGINLAAECRALESKMGEHETGPLLSIQPTIRSVCARIDCPSNQSRFCRDHSRRVRVPVSERAPLLLQRLRQNNKIQESTPETKIRL